MTLKNPQAPSSPPSLDTFIKLVEDKVYAESVTEWDKVKLVDALPLVTRANAQNLFLSLKFGSQIIEAAMSDVRARN